MFLASPRSQTTRRLAILASLGLALPPLSAQATDAEAPAAPLYGEAPTRADAPRPYIVVLGGLPEEEGAKVPATRDGLLSERLVAPEVAHAIDTVTGLGAEVRYAYDTLLKGFAARLDAKQLDAARRLPGVEAIYEDGRIRQLALPWNLDRVDQASLPLNGTYAPANTGAGAHVYVVDGGIRASHNEFKNAAGTGSRVTPVWNSYDNNADTNETCNGHGTQAASIAGGRTLGVAADVKLYAVKIFGCLGSADASVLVDGLERVATHVAANNNRPAVVNGSWGEDVAASRPLVDVAALRLIGKGIHLVAAAGNSGSTASPDASAFSPARLGLGSPTIVVGGSDAADARWPTSSTGNSLNLFAPGGNLRAATYQNDTNESLPVSGTSFAAPHVSGAAAICLTQAGNAALSPGELKARVVNCATRNVLTGLGTGSPNRLLNVNACNCGAGPTYSDMASTYWAYPAVKCLDKYGIGFPCSSGAYCGTTNLKRWEMAVFLVEAKKEEQNVPSYQGYFTDIPADVWYTPYVERLKQLGITSGCTASTYCPTSDVLRRDMAIFILKAIGQAPLTTYKGYFTDVPAGQYYTGYVEKARELGIIAGCTATTYCPNSSVTREQTASMVRNAFASSLVCN